MKPQFQLKVFIQEHSPLTVIERYTCGTILGSTVIVEARKIFEDVYYFKIPKFLNVDEVAIIALYQQFKEVNVDFEHNFAIVSRPVDNEMKNVHYYERYKDAKRWFRTILKEQYENYYNNKLNSLFEVDSKEGDADAFEETYQEWKETSEQTFN